MGSGTRVKVKVKVEVRVNVRVRLGLGVGLGSGVRVRPHHARSAAFLPVLHSSQYPVDAAKVKAPQLGWLPHVVLH